VQQSPTTIVGTVVADPVLGTGKSGTHFTTLRVASTPRHMDSTTGQWVDGKTAWVDVKLWRGLAEHTVQSLRKGDEVIAVGNLVTDEWTTEDGSPRSRLVLNAEAVGAGLTWSRAMVTKLARTSTTSEPAQPADEAAASETPTTAVEWPATPVSPNREPEPAPF
jgi:single-strand DNA-binding protein